RALPAADGRDGVVARLLHPHHGSRARAARAGVRAAPLRRWPALRGHLRRLLLLVLRGVLSGARPRPAGQPVPDPQPPDRVARGEELVLPAVEDAGPPARALRLG